MPYNLSDIVQDAYRKLGVLHEEKATGGSTTTAVIAILAEEGGDDDWNGGALFVKKTTDEAAPQGEFSSISDYVDLTGTFTTLDTLTVAIGAGDIVTFSDASIPLQQMISLVNDALQKLGDIPTVDTTTLDTEASKTEYAAAVAWKRGRPWRIDIQTRTNDADDNQWMQVSGWEYIPAAPGIAGSIVFNQQLVASRDIRVWYMAPHPDVLDFDDPILESYVPELAAHTAYLMAIRWLNDQRRGAERFVIQKLNDAESKYWELLSVHPIWQPDRAQEYPFENIVPQAMRGGRLPYPDPYTS